MKNRKCTDTKHKTDFHYVILQRAKQSNVVESIYEKLRIIKINLICYNLNEYTLAANV